METSPWKISSNEWTSQYTVLGKLILQIAINKYISKLGSYLTPTTKTNARWTKGLKVSNNALQLVKENMRLLFTVLGRKAVFYFKNKAQKDQTTKEKTD